jgi:hypothetical protein
MTRRRLRFVLIVLSLAVMTLLWLWTLLPPATDSHLRSGMTRAEVEAIAESDGSVCHIDPQLTLDSTLAEIQAKPATYFSMCFDGLLYVDYKLTGVPYCGRGRAADQVIGFKFYAYTRSPLRRFLKRIGW